MGYVGDDDGMLERLAALDFDRVAAAAGIAQDGCVIDTNEDLVADGLV